MYFGVDVSREKFAYVGLDSYEECKRVRSSLEKSCFYGSHPVEVGFCMDDRVM